jgi:hypothetical protein
LGKQHAHRKSLEGGVQNSSLRMILRKEKFLNHGSLKKYPKDSGFYTIGYADFLAILVKVVFIGTIFERMQIAMMDNGVKRRVLSINPVKTSTVLYSP